MRTQHTPYSLPTFPVYSAGFVSPNELVLGGGGGSSRSGIKNKLRAYNVSTHKSLELIDEFEFERGEDAPMSLAVDSKSHTFVCGVNSTTDLLEKGQNENCRVFGFKDHKLSLLRTHGTLTSGNLEDYQRCLPMAVSSLLQAATIFIFSRTLPSSQLLPL